MSNEICLFWRFGAVGTTMGLFCARLGPFWMPLPFARAGLRLAAAQIFFQRGFELGLARIFGIFLWPRFIQLGHLPLSALFGYSSPPDGQIPRDLAPWVPE